MIIKKGKAELNLNKTIGINAENSNNVNIEMNIIKNKHKSIYTPFLILPTKITNEELN